MFHIEYEKFQVPIVNLSTVDTNMWLTEDQIHKFLRAMFDQDLHPGKPMSIEWQDQDLSNDARLLVVCDLIIHTPLFANLLLPKQHGIVIFPNSTVNEQTDSTFDIGQTIQVDLELLGNALRCSEIKCAQALKGFPPWLSSGPIYLVVNIHIIHW